jgi:hypothetical protein
VFGQPLISWSTFAITMRQPRRRALRRLGTLRRRTRRTRIATSPYSAVSREQVRGQAVDHRRQRPRGRSSFGKGPGRPAHADAGADVGLLNSGR